MLLRSAHDLLPFIAVGLLAVNVAYTCVRSNDDFREVAPVNTSLCSNVGIRLWFVGCKYQTWCCFSPATYLDYLLRSFLCGS